MIRRMLLVMLPFGLAACAPKPPDFSYGGSYEPFYAALASAQRNLSDLSQYRGQPAQAARALAQFEFIIAEANDQVASIDLPTSAQPLIAAGDKEIRAALGIAPGTPPRTVSTALRRFASAQQTGQRDKAMQALAQPFFTLGPQATYGVLAALPPLPAVQSSAGDLTEAAASMGDFSRPL